MSKLSIKKIRRLADIEQPKAIANYLRKFLPPEKRNTLEVKVDEYSHSLMKNVHTISKSDIEKKLEELVNSKENKFGCILCNTQLKNIEDFLNHIDEVHPVVAEEIKKRWRGEGLIK